MSLAIFDLDNTLLAGDSDYLWGQFIATQGLVDKQWYEAENQKYYQQYVDGTLDITKFHAFSLRPLAENDMAELQRLHEQFMQHSILPIITTAARALIEKHRHAHDFLLIITATNRFITEPIAKLLAVDDLIATEAEIINGQFTGKLDGIPCFQSGKVERLQQWLQHNPTHDLENSWFYSDSHNDMPLLELVSYPVAVDPDDRLRLQAEKNQWPIISLR